MSRTIDDYDSMARREIIKAKQEKATSYVPFLIRKKISNARYIPKLTSLSLSIINHFDRRVQKFKSDYAEFRKEFERIKEEVSENPAQLPLTNNPFYTPQRATAQRTELFSTSTSTPLTADARRRFASSTSPGGTTTEAPENPFRDGMLGASREDYALHEHSFLQGAEARLDDFLAQGREVLDNLVDQRTVLKGTQRRLRDAANTLGLSRDVIGWIDRRRYAPSPVPQF
jgi:Golgi SNAP receptor complex protein 2